MVLVSSIPKREKEQPDEFSHKFAGAMRKNRRFCLIAINERQG